MLGENLKSYLYAIAQSRLSKNSSRLRIFLPILVSAFILRFVICWRFRQSVMCRARKGSCTSEERSVKIESVVSSCVLVAMCCER